jgi:hypothetical protein
MEINGLKKRFASFLNDTISLPGGDEVTGAELIKKRKGIYDVYRHKFASTQVENLSENDFHHFLTPTGNMSWPLQRGCKRVTNRMERLREVLKYLQNEENEIADRLNAVLQGGKFYIKGFGKNLATGLLHVFNWHKYGVWNNRSQTVLRKLDHLPNISYSNFGQSYSRFNSELQRICKDLEIDLAELGCFLWWLDDRKEL